MSTVRSVLGDIAPGELGVAYVHEHLIIDHPLVADRFPHIHLPSVEEAVGEVARCAEAGVGAMVDTMPCAAGRNVLKLAEVSRRTGVAVVAVTGLHTAKYYAAAPWALEASAEQLADLFVADITEGIDRYDYLGPVTNRTPHRAGVVKVATEGERPGLVQERWLEAAAMTHHRTGCPILTHCEGGVGGVAQIEALVGHGVDPGRVVLSHTDKVDDRGYHRELLSTGVSLEYDQFLRQEPAGGRTTIDLLTTMIEDGFLGQLMVGTDGARRSLWTELGGSPGLAYLALNLGRYLHEEACEALFVHNPARCLAF